MAMLPYPLQRRQRNGVKDAVSQRRPAFASAGRRKLPAMRTAPDARNPPSPPQRRTDDCRDLCEFLPCGYLVLDQAFTIDEINPAAVRLLGAPREDLLGTPLQRWFGDTRFDASFDALARGTTALVHV